jgi:hypothetical protein
MNTVLAEHDQARSLALAMPAFAFSICNLSYFNDFMICVQNNLGESIYASGPRLLMTFFKTVFSFDNTLFAA